MPLAQRLHQGKQGGSKNIYMLMLLLLSAIGNLDIVLERRHAEAIKKAVCMSMRMNITEMPDNFTRMLLQTDILF